MNKVRSLRSFILFSLAVFLFVLTVGTSVFFVSMREIVDENKRGELLQFLELQRIQLENSVNSEIAIVLKLADSPLLKRYFTDPSDRAVETLAREELDGYRRAFSSRSIFWVNAVDRVFYSDDNAPYTVDPDDPDDYWYNMTLYETEVYNFNINYNPDLHVSRLWINAPVFGGDGKPLGIVGTGIELTSYIDTLYSSMDASPAFYLFNAAGEITGARDVASVVEKRQIGEELSGLDIDFPGIAAGLPPGASVFLDEFSEKAAIGTIPVLEWYTVAVAPVGVGDFDPALVALFLVMLAVIALILALFNVFAAGSIQSQKRTIESLDAASKAKNDFLARMSHEIRTPMNAIIGMAEIALRADDPRAAREHIFTIKQAGTNLLSIINDILDFSKIEAGKLELVPGEYLVPSLLNDVISIVRMRTVDSQLLFVVNIDSGIPNTLYGDEIRIRQILLNLLGNAVKYTEQGHISFTVFGAPDDGDGVTLTMSVTDTGRGIKPEDMDKLFGDFSQVDRERNKGVVGTGLGLAIARRFAQAMGGDITVTSEYGKGSTFTVTLPQKIRDRRPLARVEAPERKRVLVYEQRPQYADSIVCTIDNLNVECTLVSARDAFRAELESGRYPFAFIASNLYDGVRAFCGQRGRGTQIVLLSGFGEAIADKNLSSLAMPVYATSVANILNGVTDSFTFSESGETAGFSAPDAEVLIVDDIGTNLMVAQGLLMPYGMRVTLCGGGAEAVEAAKAKRFDLILMDHMMPGMDGIEAAARIRAPDAPGGGAVPIVALTANAVSGTREMFLGAGFNDFLSKPIDVLKLGAVLERWIPKEKQLLHAERHSPKPPKAAPNPKLLAAFRRDAEKAAVTLRETADGGDLKAFTTAAHGMKSALAVVGETEASELAAALEQAGLRGDRAFIGARLGAFLGVLAGLAGVPAEAPRRAAPPGAEDTAFLGGQLRAVAAACADYDEAAAYAALNRLNERPWTAETAAALEQIRELLFLQSDFEQAGAQAEGLCRGVTHGPH